MLVHSPHEVPLVLDSGQHVAAGDGAIISVIKEEVNIFVLFYYNDTKNRWRFSQLHRLINSRTCIFVFLLSICIFCCVFCFLIN